jgi:hypothetical protein
LTVEQWLEIRKEAGPELDPETAEVTWSYAQTLDPYGVDPDLPEELHQVGRAYFTRSPGSDIWVWFGDLPDETRETLWRKINLDGLEEERKLPRQVDSLKLEFSPRSTGRDSALAAGFPTRRAV